MNSVYLIPFFLIGSLFFGMTIVVMKLQRWKALPTLVQYLNQHADGQANQQVQCFHCHSSEIIEQGEWGQGSRERIFRCQSCKKKLYRSDD